MDRELIIRARNGDRASFGKLAATLYPRLHRVAFTILRDPHLAEDATQQTMLRIWRQLPDLRDPDRFDGWAHRALVNTCYSEGGRARRFLASFSIAPEPAVPPDHLQAIVDRDQLDRAFQRLSLEHRTVLVLVYYADMKQDAAAEALGISVGTVKSRLHRAMNHLRAELEADIRAPVPTPAPSETTR